MSHPNAGRTQHAGADAPAAPHDAAPNDVAPRDAAPPAAEPGPPLPASDMPSSDMPASDMPEAAKLGPGEPNAARMSALPRVDAPPPEPIMTPAARPAAPPPPPPPPQPRRGAGPVLAAIGFLLLLAGLAWVWNQQRELAERLAALPPPAAGVDPARVAALGQRLDALEGRLGQVAQAQQSAKPPPPPADLGPLESRIAALEARKPPPPVDVAADTAPLRASLKSLGDEVAAARAAQASAADNIRQLTEQVKADEAVQATLSGRAASLRAVAQAGVALSAGQPLGAMPGAPPALARFAAASPPTDAELRLAFPAAAEAAVQASQPALAGKPLGERILLHVRSLVTVKQGDKVLVGTPAAEVLGAAQARLDAGDLAGATAALDALDPAAAAAMADWRGRAQSLLDARAALAEMARG